MTIFGMIGQLLIGFFFVFMAIYNFNHRHRFLEALRIKHIKFAVPMWVLAIVVALELLGGLGVAIGFFPEISAMYLVVFTLVVSFWLHPFWQFKGKEFWKHVHICASNLAIIGGLLLILFLYGG